MAQGVKGSHTLHLCGLGGAGPGRLPYTAGSTVCVGAVWSLLFSQERCSKLVLTLGCPPGRSYRETGEASLGSLGGGTNTELALLNGNLIWTLETEDFDSDFMKRITHENFSAV